MTDNLVSLDKFRVLRKEEDDADDQEWKVQVVETIDKIREKIISGETSGLVVLELEEESEQYKLHMMGLANYDIFTTVGLLENTKLQLLEALYDE